MKKMIIIIILIVFSIGCVYAEDNMFNEIYETNDVQHKITSEKNMNSDDIQYNEKYYCKDNLTNQEYFIYKNGSICKVDNSSFTQYEYWLLTNKYDDFHEYKMFDNVLNKEQIDFYLENGHFSYALAYIKAHDENLTYDEVYNAKSVFGNFDAYGWNFYNNGTVKCSLNFIGFENLTYSKPYITSIFGTAGWNNEPLSKYVMVIDNITMTYEEKGYVENSYRFPNGEFSSNMLDKVTHHDTPTNQTNNTNTNTTLNNQTNNTNTNTILNNLNSIIAMRNTANPLIVLLIACILIPIGIYKKRK